MATTSSPRTPRFRITQYLALRAVEEAEAREYVQLLVDQIDQRGQLGMDGLASEGAKVWVLYG